MKIKITSLLTYGLFIGVLGCTTVDTGRPKPDKAPVSCYQCDRTPDGAQYCASKRTGGRKCETKSDESGTSCIQQGISCGIGQVFGGQITLFSAPPKDKDATTFEERINVYFYKAVIPKVRKNWGKIKGKGAILIMHSYTRDGNNWIPTHLEIVRSSLSDSQAEVALNIIRDAVESTSLPVQQKDSEGNDYVLYWEWPVPLSTTRL